MFGGAQGVCWPLNEAVDLQRIVGKRLPDAEAALAEAKAALEDRGEEATQLREAIARLTGEKVALDKALAASEKRAEILQASCSPSGWKLLLSFVGGGLTAAGLSWGLRR
jgi:septal ring factor EnvC (AmiA/AmiB activator)